MENGAHSGCTAAQRGLLKFDMGKVYMMITIAILPVMIVYLLLSKYIVRGVALGSVKG